MKLRDGKYDSTRLALALCCLDGAQRSAIARAMEYVSPDILFNLIQMGDSQCWFCKTVYAEMVKKYEVIAEAVLDSMAEHDRDEALSALLTAWGTMKPHNVFSAVQFLRFIYDCHRSGRKLELISLMCPAYTQGRGGIAASPIEENVSDFVNALSNGLAGWSKLISRWRIYLWDKRGLTNPTLATTVHPRLLRRDDVEEQLQMSWALQTGILERLSQRTGIPIEYQPFTELNGSIETCRNYLSEAEGRDHLVSKAVARILRHGAEDYRRMGEDIIEHKERFRNDAFIFASAVLKEGKFYPYGTNNDKSTVTEAIQLSDEKPLRIMILIESRGHHIGALRLYDFAVDGVGRYVMPVWTLPARLRSFYWFNKPLIPPDGESLSLQCGDSIDAASS